MTAEDLRYESVEEPELSKHVYDVWAGDRKIGRVYWIRKGHWWGIKGDVDRDAEYKKRDGAAAELLERHRAGKKVKVQKRRGNGYSREVEEVEAAKPTTNPRTALNRIERALDGIDGRTVEVESLGTGLYILRVQKSKKCGGEVIEFDPMDVKSALAHLIELGTIRKKFDGFGLTLDEARATIGLTHVSTHGLSGWEERCLLAALSFKGA